jgi:membrane associated rhomboid family serine protease
MGGSPYAVPALGIAREESVFFPYSDDIRTRRPAIITAAVIALNVASLAYVSSMPPNRRAVVYAQWGFVPQRIGQLSNPQAKVWVPVAAQSQAEWPYTGESIHLELPAHRKQILASIFTSLFLHGGWLHLLGNMWFLWLFGNNIEDHLGHLGFAVFYLLGGLLAAACHWLSDPTSAVPVVGASGAVAAVLGAYAVTFPWARVRCVIVLIIFFTTIELPALLVLGIWFLEQLLEGVGAIRSHMSGGVAWWAHIGGFIAGAIIMPLWDSDRTAPGGHHFGSPSADSWYDMRDDRRRRT